MPLYEYRCSACRGHFDRLSTLAERDSARCPKCGSGRVDRVLSRFAVGRSQAREAPASSCGSADCACRTRDA